MSETWLLVGKAVILLLLFSFVWAVARSSARGVADLDSTAVAAPAFVPQTSPEPTPEPPPEPVAVVDEPPPTPVVFSPPPALPDDTGQQPAVDSEPLLAVDETASPPDPDLHDGALDLAANIRPRLIVESSPSLTPNSELELEGGVTIGRSSSSQLAIDDSFVSHMHARIFRRGPFYFIEDLGSTNGTFINGRRVDAQGQLKVHDELRLGETVFRYEE